MPRETIFLPADTAESLTGAATYLAIVASPESDVKRHKFVRAVQAYITRRDATRPDRIWRSQMVIPGLLLMKPKEIERTIDQALYRLKSHRLPAADMAWLLLGNIAQGKSIPFFTFYIDGRKPNVNVTAEWIARKLSATPLGWGHPFKDEQSWTPENVKSRVWSATKPVIHLAMALKGFLSFLHEKRRDAPISIEEIVCVPHWVTRAMDFAEWLRALIAETPSIRIADEETIQVKLR